MWVKDLPEASSRATVLLSKIIVGEQVITAASPGAVAVTRRSAVVMNRWQSVVHPGGAQQQRVWSQFIWRSNQAQWGMTVSPPSLWLPPPLFLCVLEKECVLLGPTTLFIYKTHWTLQMWRAAQCYDWTHWGLLVMYGRFCLSCFSWIYRFSLKLLSTFVLRKQAKSK